MKTSNEYTFELHVVSRHDPNSRIILNGDSLQGTWTAEQYLCLANATSHHIEFADGVIEVLDWPVSGVLDAR
jgi:hypothetical protein